MKKYVFAQCKRMARFFPGAFLAALVLLGSLLAVFSLTVDKNASKAENQKFAVAIVGYTDDPFLQMGLSALKAFDSSRFSLDIQQMQTQQANEALARGEIAAYVEVPENFMDAAFRGEILPLKFVSTTGAAGLVSIFKDEITAVFSQILLSAQKGVFGMAEAAADNGQSVGQKMDDMSIRYATYVFSRDRLYAVTELGIADALGLEGYLLCGLAVLFLLLCCLSFAPLLIKKETALARMLSAKGISVWTQALADFIAYALALLMMTALLLAVVRVFAPISLFGVFFRCVPVVVMIAAMSFMLYSLTGDLIGGILLQFFTTLAMCFLSGCLYPVFIFPAQVQKIAAWLPTGLARTQLAGCITGAQPGLPVLWLLLYSTLFVLVGSTAFARRIRGEARQ